MALSPLTPADAGEGARAKINAGLTEADKVSGLAAILAALQIQLAPYIDLVGGAPDRPGDARTLFTRVMAGSPKARPVIDKGTIADGGELGQVLRISGADTDPDLGYIDVAPRRAYYMRPGRTYLVQHHFKRFQNPSDPLQHAVELRFQNLNSNFGIVSNVRLGEPYAPTEANGAFFIDTFVGKAGAPGTPSYTVPPTSAYGVPFFRVYGNGAQTDLGLVRLYDVSDALAGGADIASILARVAGFETRLKALEGATGIDANYIAQIAADRDAVRFTRFWSRPGEAIRTWTSQIDLAPAAAAPLVVGAPYTLDNIAGSGAALLITGNAAAGPIALTRIEPGKIYTCSMVVRRTVDDTSQNAVLPRARAFSNTKADLSFLSLPSRTILAADPTATTITFTVSTAPGVADVQFPAVSGGYLRPYIAGQGTNGVIAVISISQPAEAVDLASSIGSAELVSVLADADTLGVRRDADGKATKISFSDIKKLIEAAMSPPIYWFKTIKKVSAGSQIIVPDGGSTNQLARIRLSADGDIRAAFGGGNPADGFPVAANALLTEDVIRPGAFSILAAAEGTTVICDFAMTSNLDPNLSAAISAHLARYTATLTSAQQTAIANLYTIFWNEEVFLSSRTGLVGVRAAPNTTDALMNWAQPGNAATRIGTPTADWTGMQFNGVDQALNTGILLSAAGQQNNHSMLVFVDNVIGGSGKDQIGDSNVRVGANRTTKDSTYFDTGPSSVITVGGVGGLQGVTRTDAATYNASRSGIFYPVSQAANALSKTPIYEGAVSTVAGASQFAPNKVMVTIASLSIGAARQARVEAGIKAYLAAVA